MKLVGAKPREESWMEPRSTLTRLWLTNRKVARSNGISVKELDHPEMYHVDVPNCASTRRQTAAPDFQASRGNPDTSRGLQHWHRLLGVQQDHDLIHDRQSIIQSIPDVSLLDEIWVANQHLKQIFGGCRAAQHSLCAMPSGDGGTALGGNRMQNWLGDAEATALQFDGGWPTTSMPLRDALPDDAGTEACPIFLSIFDPDDARKDFETLLRRFLAVRPTPGQRPTLLIKPHMEMSRARSTKSIRNFRIWNAFGSAQHKNIVCLFKISTEQEMADVYRSCRCYLSVSRGEGENLPLIEAIGYGSWLSVPTTLASFTTSIRIRRLWSRPK